MSRLILGLLVIGSFCFAAEVPTVQEKSKPVIAFFPLGGNAKEDLRDKCAFALRVKLDRAGTYEVIDGPRMADVVADAKEPVTFATPVEAVKELAGFLKPDVMVWGELNGSAQGPAMKLKVLDVRAGDTKPRELTRIIKEPTELRFVTEEILETLPGVLKFEQPDEVAVKNDPTADELWKKSPDLLKVGDFGKPAGWNAIYMSEYYPPPVSDSLPAVDKVCICRLAEDGKSNNVLAMNLSKECAENNGMACLSDAFKIEPDTRYRISFRYKSDGPVLHVFIKGYTLFDNIKGEKVPREIYRRQVPPTGGTHGKWVTIVDDLNPQHVAFPVQTLRVDLYAYLTPGVVMFDDVVVKAVGKQNRKAVDDGIKAPISRPKGAK